MQWILLFFKPFNPTTPKLNLNAIHVLRSDAETLVMDVEDDAQLRQAAYWDSKYINPSNDEPTHEWYRSSRSLQPFFEKHLYHTSGLRPCDNPLILHLGSGDSIVPVDLAAKGYNQQLCTDFSEIVVKTMAERHRQLNGIKWAYLDVRDMKGIEDKSIDIAFDKGTLDAMVHGSPWNPPAEVKEDTGKYMREVGRVLADDGIFLMVSFRQPHFVKPLLGQGDLWDVETQVFTEQGSFDAFGHIMRKKRP